MNTAAAFDHFPPPLFIACVPSAYGSCPLHSEPGHLPHLVNAIWIAVPDTPRGLLFTNLPGPVKLGPRIPASPLSVGIPGSTKTWRHLPGGSAMAPPVDFSLTLPMEGLDAYSMPATMSGPNYTLNEHV